MKRELKFRVWHTDLKEMLYDFSFPSSQHINKQIDALLSPIMQYTGLKDSKGIDIYEGDILRFPLIDKWEEKNYSCFEVFFNDGDANSDYNIGFSINRMHNHGCIGGGYIPSFKPKTTKKMEIIGNIYENPELLSAE